MIERRHVFRGSSKKMEEIRDIIAALQTAHRGTVLIQGPSGTGKGIVARLIHNGHGPFETIDCCALPEDLVEDVLFGHERGAFTGAIRSRKGAFELAHGGTLFLDEIGDMPLSTQSKLLSVLEEREFKRVGGEKLLSTDVRVISATNKNLKRLVEEKKFREDLYYRLAVVQIDLPSLKSRKSDIPELIQHFRELIGAALWLAYLPILTPDAMELLINHPWPGNVRELRNVMERALTLYGREPILKAKNFALEDISPSASRTIPGGVTTIKEMEKAMIVQAIEECGQDKRRAAHLLGISLKTIYNKIAKYGIQATKEYQR